MNTSGSTRYAAPGRAPHPAIVLGAGGEARREPTILGLDIPSLSEAAVTVSRSLDKLVDTLRQRVSGDGRSGYPRKDRLTG
jgi:hypothetical protein